VQADGRDGDKGRSEDRVDDVRASSELLESTCAELADHRRKLKRSEELRRDLEHSLGRLRAAHEEVVRQLEEEVASMRAEATAAATARSRGMSSASNIGMESSALLDAEERVRRLEFRYRSKSAEVEALLRLVTIMLVC
jgi:chromosome segregation ATPase